MSTELKPNVSKTLVKGAIVLAIFSLFLEVDSANLLNYAIFLGISISLVFAYMSLKGLSTYVLTEDSVIIRQSFQKERAIKYSEISQLYISQGPLAKRFKCGTLLLEVKRRPDSKTFLGSTFTEILKDIKDPKGASEIISSRTASF